MLRLWQIPYSTNVERVALALAHKGLDAEPVVVDPADRSTVVELTGQELVPVLEDDGRVVSDSLAILAHLESSAPEAPALYPRDPARRAEVEAVLDWFDRVWKGPPNRLAQAIEAGRDPAEPELRRWGDDLRSSLHRFEALLQDRNYLFGQAFGVLDAAVFPFLKYGVFINDKDDELFHRILAEHLTPGTEHQRLRAWIARVDELPRAGLASEGAESVRPQS